VHVASCLKRQPPFTFHIDFSSTGLPPNNNSDPSSRNYQSEPRTSKALRRTSSDPFFPFLSVPETLILQSGPPSTRDFDTTQPKRFTVCEDSCATAARVLAFHSTFLNHTTLYIPPIMSEAATRAGAARGRGSARGGRGGHMSRGGRPAARTNGDKVDHAESPSAVEEDADVTELRKKYGASVASVKDLFPTWSDEDVLYALQECDGDVQKTVERIMDGRRHLQRDILAIHADPTL
jgi:hypothetical protein